MVVVEGASGQAVSILELMANGWPSRYSLKQVQSGCVPEPHSFHKMVAEQDPEGAAETKPQMLLCPTQGH